METLKQYCDWPKMESDVRDLIKDCILCRCAKMTSPTKVHLGLRSRPTKPNQALHFDYYYVQESTIGSKYILMLRDGFSRFTMLFDFEGPDGNNAVEAILSWISLFGVPDKFFSDNGPHFRNKTMKELCRRLKIEHEFSTAYCAWSNGLAERVMRDIHQLLRILIHEHRLDRMDWPKILHLITYTLNQRPSRVLNRHSPLEVHTGQKPKNALDFIFENGEFKDVKIDRDVEQYLKQLNDTLDALYDEAFDATKKIDTTTRKQDENLPIFEIGDYALYSFMDRPNKQGKLYYQWMGPFQITDTKSDYVYVIQDLVSGRQTDAHVTRLSFYSNSQLNVTGDLIDLISRQGMEYDIYELSDLKWDEETKTFAIRTSWLGFQDQEDTWEPFQSLLDQIPLMLLKFIDDFGQQDEALFNRLWKQHGKRILTVISKQKYDFEKHFKIIKPGRRC